MDHFTKVEKHLKETNLIFQQTNKVMSFWSFLEDEKITQNGSWLILRSY